MLTLEKKLEQYRMLKIKLSEVKQDEMDLRIDIASELSKDALEAGTHNFDFEGLKVKLVSKMNYKIDKNILETLELTEEEAICIRWKPELDMKAYKAEDETETLNEAIIATTGAPTLTVELSDG